MTQASLFLPLQDDQGQSAISDLAAGVAAEHLVCAELLLSGFTAYRTDQVCAYDVAAEVSGGIVRIQVKATRGPRAIPQNPNHRAAYMWHVRRAGKSGRRVYSAGEFDLLALVALDCRRVAYLPPSALRQTIHIRTHDDPSGRTGSIAGKRGKTFEGYSFAAALLGLAHEGGAHHPRGLSGGNGRAPR